MLLLVLIVLCIEIYMRRMRKRERFGSDIGQEQVAGCDDAKDKDYHEDLMLLFFLISFLWFDEIRAETRLTMAL